MALVIKDRVKETTATSGAGTYTLAGASTGFESFASVGDGNTTYYCCTDGTNFEIGIGTYTASGTTLARTTILQSSNSDNAVSWADTSAKNIFCTMPSDKSVFLDGDGDLSFTGANYNVLWDKSDDAFVFADNAKAKFGTDGDIEIYHNNTNAFIYNDTGHIYIHSGANNKDIIFKGNDGGETKEAGKFDMSKSGKLTLNEGFEVSSNGNVTLKDGVDIVFEGDSDNSFETTLYVADPTADRTVLLPNASGTVALQNASIDMNGTELILDADADTSITADTDDQIDIRIGGTDKLRVDSTGRLHIGTDGNLDRTRLLTQRTTGIGTSATVIASVGTVSSFGGHYFVTGRDANSSANRFCDQLVVGTNGSVVVLHSSTVRASPHSRSYDNSGENLRVTMGGGSYTIQVFCVDQLTN